MSFLDDNPFEVEEEDEDDWQPGSARYEMKCHSMIEIAISARNLINKDLLSKTDSVCIVMHKPIGSKNFVELARTEVVNNTFNPDFAQKVLMPFNFHERQPLRFEMYDVDISTKISRLNFIGFIEVTLAEILSYGIKGYKRPLRTGLPMHVQIEREKKNSRRSSWACRFSRKSSTQDPENTRSPTPSPTPTPNLGRRKIKLENSDESSKDKSSFSFSLSRMSSFFDLSEERAVGELILVGEELACLKEEVTLQLGGTGMGHYGCLCLIKPRIYFIISRQGPRPNTFIPVHISGVVRGRNPRWPPFTLRLRRLCNGDQKVSLKIEFFDKSFGIKEDKRIGHCITSLMDMNMKIGSLGIPIEGDQGKGTMLILLCKVSPFSTFLDYIQGGVSINCCIAIDFTSSNGWPDDPTSLHYTAKGKLNPYEQAIVAVGSVLQDYDSDKNFLSYGFGAYIPPYGLISHGFYITLSDNGFCYGVPGVLETYRNCVKRIDFFGPTYFANVINHVAHLARQVDGGEEYFILLIITDGCINDMEKTKEAIVKASELPLSIIIVGVGDEDYTKMEELDGDSKRISWKGQQATRDLVQFVPYRDTLTWLSESTGKSTRGNLRLNSPDIIYDILKVQKEDEDDESEDGEDEEKKKKRKEKKKRKKEEEEREQQQQNQDKKSTKPYKDDACRKLAMKKLAKEVLAEIPEQFCSYMKYKGIKPRKPGTKGEEEEDTDSNPGSIASGSIKAMKLKKKSPLKKQGQVEGDQHLTVPTRLSANSRRGT